MKNFALTGVAGYVAERHLKAITATGHRIVAACDPHDSVGVLDRYSLETKYFAEFERFDRHIEKLRRGPERDRVHYVSICSPNYLHDAHIRFALRVGADAICEKPIVINPWNLDALQELELESGQRVYTVLQLRYSPAIAALKQSLPSSGRSKHDVCVTYVTARGGWYDVSWKGSEERSGGIVTNIGIHLLDLLVWLFGRTVHVEVHLRERRRASGFIELERARVQWLLSTDPHDLPFAPVPGSMTTLRSITVDGTSVEVGDASHDLHVRAYEDVLRGRGCGIEESRPAIVLAHTIRQATPAAVPDRLHPMVAARAV